MVFLETDPWSLAAFNIALNIAIISILADSDPILSFIVVLQKFSKSWFGLINLYQTFIDLPFLEYFNPDNAEFFADGSIG